jgi:hypothetical protein
LYKLYLNKAAIGGFAATWYWTSREDVTYNLNLAWLQNFSNGSQDFDSKSDPWYVRAIRSF